MTRSPARCAKPRPALRLTPGRVGALSRSAPCLICALGNSIGASSESLDFPHLALKSRHVRGFLLPCASVGTELGGRTQRGRNPREVCGPPCFPPWRNRPHASS